MVSNTLSLLSAALVAVTAVFLFQRGRRNAILDQLHISRRRVSGAKTPPRSLSPGKGQLEASQHDYKGTFPPSRRFTLAKTSVRSKLDTAHGDWIASPPDWEQNIVPLDVSYLDAKDTLYTPCEFSIKEIKALGDFPDYATLSGVPLPVPYPEFDIKKALPRPYRPFRWAYHQTMCM